MRPGSASTSMARSPERSRLVDQPPRLERRLQLQILGHAAGELVERADRRRAIAAPFQEEHQASEDGLVVRGQLQPAARPRGGLLEPTLPLRLIGERPGRFHRALTMAGALPVQPILKLRPGAGDVETVEQVTPVERQRPLGIAGGQRPLHRHGVAPEPILGDADLVVSPARDDFAPQLAAQEVERASQGGTGMLLVQLGPEEREERVPPVVTPR